MRKLLALLLLALVAAACGGSTEPAASPDPEVTSVPETSSQSETTAAAATDDGVAEGGEANSTPTGTEAVSSFDGPPAPNFELALSDGSTFKLSDEQKPVYVVFWAEW